MSRKLLVCCLVTALPYILYAEVETDFIVTTNAAATNVFQGRVGIGTASPSRELVVDGEVEAKEFYFDNGILAMGYGTNTRCIFSGEYAGDQNSGDKSHGIGYRAASENTGEYANGFGYRAACYNDGERVGAVGAYAAYHNYGSYVNALGYYALYQNSADCAFAAGIYAGYMNEGKHLCGIGQDAGKYNSGRDVNALGYAAAKYNTGSYCNFLGAEAGRSNAVSYVNIIGAWNPELTTVEERTYLGGDLELYDPPDSGGETSGNLLKFQGGATIEASGTNIHFSAGGVGIGTNAPSEMLEVAGAARINGGITYVAPLGDIPMGIYTNMP